MTIYHIIKSQIWKDIKDKDSYSPPSLSKEGFIHASKKEQVLPTANRRYQGQDDLLLLVIDSDKVKPKIKLEYSTGAKEEHPHIYGSLNLDAVINIIKLVTNEDGKFENIDNPSNLTTNTTIVRKK